MNFHEVRFPASLSFGSVGGPERRTDIVTLANGFEERNTPWAHSRRRYDAGTRQPCLAYFHVYSDINECFSLKQIERALRLEISYEISLLRR